MGRKVSIPEGASTSPCAAPTSLLAGPGTSGSAWAVCRLAWTFAAERLAGAGQQSQTFVAGCSAAVPRGRQRPIQQLSVACP